MSKKSVVGVDFGKGIVRAVELADPTGARPVLLRHAELPLPADAVVGGEVRDARAVAAVLKRLWAEGGFTSKKVVLGIGNSRVLVRDLTLPKMPLESIREALPFQVQDSLPVPVADALLDFYPTSEGEADGGPVIHGLLVAGMRAALETNVRALQLAGLRPVSVDLIPFALSRLLLPAGDETHTAIVHIGAVTTVVVFVLAGVPQFVRIIPTGGDDISRALVERAGLDEEAAERTKRESGLAGSGAPADRMVTEVIRDVTGELLTGLRNTFSYYSHTKGAVPVERVLLSGGGAQLAGLADVVADITRLPAGAALDAAARFSLGDAVDAARFEQATGDFAVALGLAVGSAA
jgi:type IV pilus assembly protein PilM